MGRFIGMDRGTVRDVGGDEGNAIGFMAGYVRDRAAIGFAGYDHRLALAGLIGGQAAVLAVAALVCRLHVSAEICAVHRDIA